MLTTDMLSLLCCPSCQADELQVEGEIQADGRIEEGTLRCPNCAAAYPVKWGVPMLMPHAVLVEEYWKLWRDHLEKFHARREDRIQHPDRLVTRSTKVSTAQPKFAEFTGVKEGALLDVGCGPGKFRFRFNSDKVNYYGLDPIAFPVASDFRFVRGLAEYIPFRNGTFTDIVVLAALDHFRDLDRFFSEASRVLQPTGRLHIMQSVHEVRGPISFVKMLAHTLKDTLEEREIDSQRSRAPKHMAEFTSHSLRGAVGNYFDVVAVESYSSRWYAPTKLFLSLSPKGRQPSGTVAGLASAAKGSAFVGPIGPA